MPSQNRKRRVINEPGRDGTLPQRTRGEVLYLGSRPRDFRGIILNGLRTEVLPALAQKRRGREALGVGAKKPAHAKEKGFPDLDPYIRPKNLPAKEGEGTRPKNVKTISQASALAPKTKGNALRALS